MVTTLADKVETQAEAEVGRSPVPNRVLPSMRMLVIGCGSIGRRHAENLLHLGQQVFIYDRDLMKAQELVSKLGTSIYDFKSHHLAIDAFIICTPPEYHIPFALEALEHDSHIFIEKPISHKYDGVNELIEQAKAKGKIIQVGYQLRFEVGLRKVAEILKRGDIGKILTASAEFGLYLPLWHPQEDYRDLYVTKLGIILDGSHEIDYLRWLLGEITAVSCFAGQRGDLELGPGAEDVAFINLLFESGILANVRLDMLQREYSRYLKLLGSKGQILWTFPHGGASLFLNDGYSECQPASEMGQLGDNEPYLAEMRDFVDCIQTGKRPLVTAEDALQTLKVAEATRLSAFGRGHIYLNPHPLGSIEKP